MPLSTQPATRRRQPASFVGLVTGLLLVLSVLLAPSASAALTVTVVNTDGQGVAARNAPRVGAVTGYGAPAGASVTAICWTWGDAVGPYTNRLWWQIQYDGRQFYAADRYLSTPNPANQPPAGQPQCGAAPAPPPPPPPVNADPSVWVGSPIQGRWSSSEGANTHHLLGRANPRNDFAVDLEAGAGQQVILYAAPQVSSVQVTARIDTVARPTCVQGDGGSYVTVGFYVNGTRIGSATYGHIDPAVAQGQTVNRWGTVLGTIGTYQWQTGCWEGAHLHFEMYSSRNYACYNKTFALGQPIARTNFVGYTGGNRASGPRQGCP